MDLSLADFFLIANMVDPSGLIRGREMVKEFPMELLLELPLIENLNFSVGRKELQRMDELTRQFLGGLGFDESEKKRGILT